MRKVVIASAARTPIGNFGGSLKSVPAKTLGAVACEEAIKGGAKGDPPGDERPGAGGVEVEGFTPESLKRLRAWRCR